MKVKDIAVAVAAVVVVLVACFALASVRPNLPPRPSQPFVKGVAKGEKAKKEEGKVVMRINGEPITQKEFEAFVMAAPEEARMFYASPEGRRYLADELVKMKVLAQEAERRGLTNDPALQAQIELMATQVAAGKALQAVVRERVDQRIRGEYEKEKANAIGLRHILVAYQGSAIPPRDRNKPALTPDQAMQKASALTARIRGGASFADVARGESDDQQSAAEGGSIGATSLDQLPPDIAAAVKTLKPGQVSDPVKTQFGVHIFKVETPTLDELRPALTQKVQQDVAKEAVDQLQKSAKVELDPSFFPAARRGQPSAGAEGRGTLNRPQ